VVPERKLPTSGAFGWSLSLLSRSGLSAGLMLVDTEELPCTCGSVKVDELRSACAFASGVEDREDARGARLRVPELKEAGMRGGSR